MECIKIDLSFKIVQGKTNLFSIAGWDKNSKRMYSLYYAYATHRLIPITGIKVWVYAFLNLEIYTIYIKLRLRHKLIIKRDEPSLIAS